LPISTDYATPGLEAGSYSIYRVDVPIWRGSFMGDCSGTTISNVAFDWMGSVTDSAHAAGFIGAVIYSPYFSNGWFKIVDYSSTTRSFSIASDGTFTSASAVFFGGKKELYTDKIGSTVLSEISFPVIVHKGEHVIERKGT